MRLDYYNKDIKEMFWHMCDLLEACFEQERKLRNKSPLPGRHRNRKVVSRLDVRTSCSHHKTGCKRTVKTYERRR